VRARARYPRTSPRDTRHSQADFAQWPGPSPRLPSTGMGGVPSGLDFPATGRFFVFFFIYTPRTSYTRVRGSLTTIYTTTTTAKAYISAGRRRSESRITAEAYGNLFFIFRPVGRNLCRTGGRGFSSSYTRSFYDGFFIFFYFYE